MLNGWDGPVAAWLPGTECQGVAEALFGREPFSRSYRYLAENNRSGAAGALSTSGEEIIFRLES